MGILEWTKECLERWCSRVTSYNVENKCGWAEPWKQLKVAKQIMMQVKVATSAADIVLSICIKAEKSSRGVKESLVQVLG